MAATLAWRLGSLGAASFLGVVAVAGASTFVLDLDGDGLSGTQEREAGTDGWTRDSDRDALADGWEVDRRLDALSNDTDEDGLIDGLEVAAGADPLRTDTDRDGVADGLEGDSDCNGDGHAALVQSDDDGDGRPDGAEAQDERCDPDADGDGVKDGSEGAVTCVRKPDCDGDGLDDGVEGPAGFSALDPDTFDIHLPDSVSYAFQKAGQPASSDGDHDGIPDSWEGSGGLISWGSFAPQAGRRDVLVEFLRVVGPDSGRFSIPLDATYEKLRSVFAMHEITLQWVETTVRRATEPLPVLVPTLNDAYYRSVLENGTYSTNPYVLTVVLNPQLNQSEVFHAGVAPIRGMLAAVDLGQHLTFHWDSADGQISVSLTPAIESLIRVGRQSEAQVTGGIHPDGSYYVTVSGAEIRWSPYWFRNPHVIYQGKDQALNVNSIELFPNDLAHTIFHEMGHTFGLCHTHDPDCAVLLPVAERSRTTQSSMSYESAGALVEFLPGEWTRVLAFLQCPPPEPVRLVAVGATRDARLEAKYAYGEEDLEGADIRSCGDFTPVTADLTPRSDIIYQPSDEWAAPAPATNSLLPAVGFGLLSVAAGGAACAFVVRRGLRHAQPPQFP